MPCRSCGTEHPPAANFCIHCGADLRDAALRRASERAQGEALGMVAHELRSPLAALKGYAQLMQRRGTYSEKAVGVIVARTRHLERLIGDLLDLSRLEAGRLELRPDRMDLVALVHSMVEHAQVLTQLHAIRSEAPTRPLEGWWDRDRLEQVFGNLLTNAVRYSPQGGEILVRVQDLGREARVSVADEGLGIAAAAVPRLFHRFYQAPEGRGSGAERGLGLGLYITRSLVEEHGGRIEVASEIGRGTTFTVILPYEGPAGEGPAGEGPAGEGAAEGGGELSGRPADGRDP